MMQCQVDRGSQDEVTAPFRGNADFGGVSFSLITYLIT